MRARRDQTCYAHRDVGFESPTRHPVVLAVWEGARRTIGVAPAGKAALVTEKVRALVGPLGSSLIGIRDRALLLVTFAGAFAARRLWRSMRSTHGSSMTGYAGLAPIQDGPGGRGAPRGPRLRFAPRSLPVHGLKAWIEIAGAVDDCPLFQRVRSGGTITGQRLTAQSVALIVKRHVARAGLDPSQFAGHSLRAGFVMSAALAHVPDSKIARQTGHRSLQTLHPAATVGVENASTDVGLWSIR